MSQVVAALQRSSLLERAMERRRRELVKKLDADYQRCLKAAAAPAPGGGGGGAAPEDPALSAHGEYRRAMAEVNRRYDCSGGTVLSWGSDESQQLGVPDLPESASLTYGPLRVRFPGGAVIRQVSAGGLHSVALGSDGTPYTWGSGDQGILGRNVEEDADGDTSISQATPTAVGPFYSFDGTNETGTVVEVVAGSSCSLFRTIRGNVYISGFFRDGDQAQIRYVPSSQESVLGSNERPVQVKLPAPAVRIYSGQSAQFCAALLTDGSLVTWGMGHDGQLARSRTMRPNQSDDTFELGRDWFVSVSDRGHKVVDETILRDKFLTPGPVLYRSLTSRVEVLDVACSLLHMLVVGRLDDGNGSTLVFAAGHNVDGRLGLELPQGQVKAHELTVIPALQDKGIVRVAVGETHSLALDVTGRHLYTWGEVTKGQLGLGERVTNGGARARPTLVDFPPKEVGTHPVPHTFRDIFAGAFTSFAITADNELFSWGFGELQATGHNVVPGMDVYFPSKLKLLVDGNKYTMVQGSGGDQHSLVVAVADNTLVSSSLPNSKKRSADSEWNTPASASKRSAYS